MTRPASPTALGTRVGPIVAVCGAGASAPEAERDAWEVGRHIAEMGGVLLCGGRTGVMAAAAGGARSQGGLTIGLLPGSDPREANEFIDLPLATGLGNARNAVIAMAAGAIVALPGGMGTLSEIALGLKMGRTIVGLHFWKEIREVVQAQDPEEAAGLAMEAARIRFSN